MTHNGTTLPEVSIAGHPRSAGSVELSNALNEWEQQRRRKDDEEWQLCFWDGRFRKPSAIRALIVVP